MKPAPLHAKLPAQRKPIADVVGLEVGAAHPEGVPAVRLLKREDGKVELVAAGFLRLPGQLPEAAPAEGAEMPVWSLPRPYQARHAALALNSTLAFMRHASGTEEEAESRQTPYRTVSHILAADLPPLKAGLPEFQAAWAAKLFPEGHAPTTCSIQISSAAAINGFLASPLFQTLTGTAVVLFVFPNHASLAAFHESKLVLYREHPIGYGHVRTAIANQMRIETSLADSVLQDTFIDPVPMIEPVLKALFRQVEISSDYLLRRRNCQTQNFFVCGLPSGAKYWSAIFSRMMNQPLALFHPFDGLVKPQRPGQVPENIAEVEPFLMTAIGAARAVLEDV
jgi:hypothetical protein